jgi:hypothetical protein
LIKVLEGFGDVNAYGFASQADDGPLCSWVVGKLDVFRHWFYRQLYRGPNPSPLPGMRQSNTDRSSDFVGYYISKLPPSFVIQRHLEADGPMFDPRVPF